MHSIATGRHASFAPDTGAFQFASPFANSEPGSDRFGAGHTAGPPSQRSEARYGTESDDDHRWAFDKHLA